MYNSHSQLPGNAGANVNFAHFVNVLQKRPRHPRRILPTRIYLAGFMMRRLPPRKRGYAHRHGSARVLLPSASCSHKAMGVGARARRRRVRAKKNGSGFFSCCCVPHTFVPPSCNVATGDLGRGAAALGGVVWYGDKEPEPGRWSLRWRRCAGVGRLPGPWGYR